MNKSFEDNLPSKSAIFLYWKDRLHTINISIDWGEPSCWACGFHYEDKYDIKNSNASLETICKGWEKIPLQRCHIVPRSLGGKNTEENLFLLCKECHDLAPNTIFPDIFFEWSQKQNWHDREAYRINAAMKSFSVLDDDREKILSTLNSLEFQNWEKGKFSLHRPQSNYGSKSFRMTPSSLIGLAKYYIQNQNKTT